MRYKMVVLILGYALMSAALCIIRAPPPPGFLDLATALPDHFVKANHLRYFCSGFVIVAPFPEMHFLRSWI